MFFCAHDDIGFIGRHKEIPVEARCIQRFTQTVNGRIAAVKGRHHGNIITGEIMDVPVDIARGVHIATACRHEII